MRKSPLPRPRKPMRRQSKRRRAEQPARARCVAAVRERSHGRCEARLTGCEGEAVHVHEVLMRSQGGSTTCPDNCRHVCAHCHRQIHRWPLQSYEMGLLKRRSA